MSRPTVVNCVASILIAACGQRVALPDKNGSPKAPPIKRPNVLLLISDDQRPDTIAAFGNRVIRTPHLDRLVAGGSTFPRATCAHPLCVPSRAELLTGCTGFTNGVHPPRMRPNIELATWPGVMRRAGYHTWWVGKWHIRGRPSTRGYEESLGLFAAGRAPEEPQFDSRGREVTGYRGWRFQTDAGRQDLKRPSGLTPDISVRFADAAIAFINRRPAKPFFLQVNFTAPHDPLLLPPRYEQAYEPAQLPLPDNFRPEHPFDHGNLRGRDEKLLPWPRTKADVRAELATYYAVISHMDAQIGRVLQTLQATGQAENTIVIFCSDHGLALGSHGLMGKQNMYEHTINVPLVIRGPGIPRGRVLSAQCYLRDLFPTVCELCGVNVPASVEGKSLAGVLRGQAEDVYPFIVGYFRDDQRMIRTDRWKLVRYPQIGREQLFDLQADPLETRDLSADQQWEEVRRRLRGQLAGWLRQHGDPMAAATERPL